jgi:hypothetical protein
VPPGTAWHRDLLVSGRRLPVVRARRHHWAREFVDELHRNELPGRFHLGGSYWQRASFDSVVVVCAIFGLIVLAPRFPKFRPHNWLAAGALAVAILIFAVMLVDSFRYANRMLYRIQVLEERQPPL